MLGLLMVLVAQLGQAAKPPPSAEGTPRTKAILAQLGEPVDMMLEVPLETVLEGIKRASKKGPNDPGLPIYVDPLGLQMAGRTLTSPVTISTRLTSPTGSSGPSPPSDCPTSSRMTSDHQRPAGHRTERHEVAVRACDARCESGAHGPARGAGPDPVPHRDAAGDVLAYLQRGHCAAALTSEPIKILLVPDGLRMCRVAQLADPVDLEGVPLKTTLRLLFDQLGLGCVVKDGRLVIHSRQGFRKLTRAAEK